jgi:hypothetical protein
MSPSASLDIFVFSFGIISNVCTKKINYSTILSLFVSGSISLSLFNKHSYASLILLRYEYYFYFIFHKHYSCLYNSIILKRNSRGMVHKSDIIHVMRSNDWYTNFPPTRATSKPS